jgi:urease accessory protein
MADSTDQLHLFQLADASLPTGGYAFSSGLEATARLGLIRDHHQLEQYLRDYAQQVCTGEIPFIDDCYHLSGPLLSAEAIKLTCQLDAFLTIPSIRHASTVQGRNWLVAAQGVFQDKAIGEIEPFYRDHGLPCHYTLCFGLSLRTTLTAFQTTCNLYLYLALRDQVSVAVRLGLIGPQYGTELLARILDVGMDMMEKYADLGARKAFRCGPLMEIAQAWHPNIYSKLFQN